MPSQGLGLAPRLRYLAGRARRIDVGSVIERAKETSHAARQVDAGGRRRHAVVGRVPPGRLPGLHRLRLRDPEPRRARDLHDAPGVEPALAEVRPPRLPAHVPGQGRVRPHVQRPSSAASGWSSRRATPTRCAPSPSATARSSRRSPWARPAPVCTATTPPRSTDWDEFHRGLLAARRAAHRGGHPAARRPRRRLPRHGQHDARHGLLRRREDAHPRDGAEVRARRGERPDDVRRLLHDARRRTATPSARATTRTGTCTRSTPTRGFVIADFQLPMMDEVRGFVDQVARVVPQVQYVGWDIVVTPDGPGARRGQLGRRRLREQAERHRHPHRPQAALPRGHRVLTPPDRAKAPASRRDAAPFAV